MEKIKRNSEEPAPALWIITYSDMVTLLLVFFVLVLSYSNVELAKFRAAMGSMKGAFGLSQDQGILSENIKTDPLRMTADGIVEHNAIERLELIKDFEKMIYHEKLTQIIDVEITNSGIKFRLGDALLFDRARAVLKPEAYEVLDHIAEFLNKDFETLYIEGHTDDTPVHTEQFPSNWELSAARALSVVKYFQQVQNLNEKKLAVIAHGPYRPLVPNDSNENKAKNRRVEIIISW